MTVPLNITTHTRQRQTETRTDSGGDLDRGLLNPSPCEYQIYTDANSLAYETVREVQPNIPLASKDLNIPLASKDLNIPSVRRIQTSPTMSSNSLQKRLTLLGILVLKLYANVIQSPVLYYQVVKNFLVAIGD